MEVESRRVLAIAAVVASVLAASAVPALGSEADEERQDRQLRVHGKVLQEHQRALKKGKDTSAELRARSEELAADIAGAKDLVSGLEAFRDGLTPILAELGDGLLALKDGAKKLGTAVSSQEWGVVQAYLGGSAPTDAVAGAILVSPDIPDDANSALVSGTMIVSVPAAASSLPITLRAGVRSAESDGNGATDPVASAGIVSMGATAPAGLGLTLGGGNTGLPSSVPITSKPNAAAAGAPVYPIPDKAPRVDAQPNPFTFPTDKTIDLTDATTLSDFGGAGVGPFTVSNASASARPLIVNVTVRFNDLSASGSDTSA